METNQELRIYMKAARAKLDDGNGRHLSEDEMIAYCQERTGTAERETARLHILQCDHCLQLFRDVSDFFEPLREDEEEIDQLQVRRAWNDFWPRTHARKKAAANIVESLRRISFPGVAWPLAACLLITLGLAIVFLWRGREEKQHGQSYGAPMPANQQDLEARLDQMRQMADKQLMEEREQRIKAEARAQALQTQVDELQGLRQNVPIYTRLLSSQKGEEDDWRLSVPSSANVFWLSLTRSKPYEFPEYSIELIDQSGRKFAERRGLRPIDSGYLSFALSRSDLRSGKYNLTLYGHRGKSRQKLGEYELSLSFTP